MSYDSLTVTRKLADAINAYAEKEVFPEEAIGQTVSIGTPQDGEIILYELKSPLRLDIYTHRETETDQKIFSLNVGGGITFRNLVLLQDGDLFANKMIGYREVASEHLVDSIPADKAALIISALFGNSEAGAKNDPGTQAAARALNLSAGLALPPAGELPVHWTPGDLDKDGSGGLSASEVQSAWSFNSAWQLKYGTDFGSCFWKSLDLQFNSVTGERLSLNQEEAIAFFETLSQTQRREILLYSAWPEDKRGDEYVTNWPTDFTNRLYAKNPALWVDSLPADGDMEQGAILCLKSLPKEDFQKALIALNVGRPAFADRIEALLGLGPTK